MEKKKCWVNYAEKTIFAKEKINVEFFKNGINTRDDVALEANYHTEREAKNSDTVADFIEKLKKQFKGYSFKVYDGDDNIVSEDTPLGVIRDTYD